MIEILMVVAIMGILAAVAGFGVTLMARTGKVNGEATALASVLNNVRTRALTDHCTHFLQFNGTTYDASGAPSDVPRRTNYALVFRKADCGSNNRFFEPGAGDHLIAEYPLQEYTSELEVPATVLSGQRLLAASVSIGWNGTGQRGVAADDDLDGVSTDLALAGNLVLKVRANPATDTNQPSRDIMIPEAARVSAQ